MTKNRSIIFIHKDKLELYDEFQSKLFQFVFQPTVFQDLELIDAEQLDTQLKTFITTNKITPSSILFIIADLIVFEKIFTSIPVNNKDAEIQKFLDNIPFEHVSFKVIDGAQSFKVQAINKELYTSLGDSFQSQGFTCLGIISQSSLGDSFKNSQNLSTEMVRYILTNFDTVRKQTFIQEEVKKSSTTGEELNLNDPVNLAKPISKYRLSALISVFVVLIGVLGFVVYKQQFTTGSKASPVPPTIKAPPLTSPSPAISDPPSSSPSAKPT